MKKKNKTKCVQITQNVYGKEGYTSRLGASTKAHNHIIKSLAEYPCVATAYQMCFLHVHANK
jgi:hypothetical protein